MQKLQPSRRQAGISRLTAGKETDTPFQIFPLNVNIPLKIYRVSTPHT